MKLTYKELALLNRTIGIALMSGKVEFDEVSESVHKKVTNEVAKRTKVQTSTLSNWKAGRYTPKSNKIKAIADYFGVSIEYFLE